MACSSSLLSPPIIVDSKDPVFPATEGSEADADADPNDWLRMSVEKELGADMVECRELALPATARYMASRSSLSLLLPPSSPPVPEHVASAVLLLIVLAEAEEGAEGRGIFSKTQSGHKGELGTYTPTLKKQSTWYLSIVGICEHALPGQLF
mgnify:FL=1